MEIFPARAWPRNNDQKVKGRSRRIGVGRGRRSLSVFHQVHLPLGNGYDDASGAKPPEDLEMQVALDRAGLGEVGDHAIELEAQGVGAELGELDGGGRRL